MLPTAAQIVEKLPQVLRRHKLMTGWMTLTGEDPVQLVRIRDDHFGYADMSDGFLRLIVIEPDYEATFFGLADALLARGGVFLDVGANYGLFSFGLAGRHGRSVDFHLFEPNAKLAAAIRRTQALYPQMRCTLTEAAVADRPGEVCFSIDDEHTGWSHIVAEGGLKVPAITLDDYLADRVPGGADLVKIDIEGHELRALRGAEASLRARRIRAVYFEYCEKWLIRVSEPARVIEFLDSVGFAACFCRACDYEPRGGATHTLSDTFAGGGLPLLPIQGHDRPETTDLLAVPHERLVRLGASR